MPYLLKKSLFSSPLHYLPMSASPTSTLAGLTTPSPIPGIAIPYFSCLFSASVSSDCAKNHCASIGSPPSDLLDDSGWHVVCICNPNRTLASMSLTKECKNLNLPTDPLTYSVPTPGVQWRVTTTNLTTCAFDSYECAYAVCEPQDSPVVYGSGGVNTSAELTGQIVHCVVDYDTALITYAGQYNLSSGCNATAAMRCLPPGSFKSGARRRVALLLPFLTSVLLASVAGVGV